LSAPGLSAKAESIKQKILPKEEPKPDPGLTSLLKTWDDEHSESYAVYIQELNGSKRFAGLNENSKMIPASTYKLFVAYAIYHAAENNELNLQTKTRTGYTIQTCIDRMLVQSDNECAKALGFLYGWEKINNELKQIGISSTNLNNYNPGSENPVNEKATTAKDEAILIDKLQSNKLLNQAHTNELFGYLKKQIYKERIAAGVPKGITVATKPGWLDYVQADAGIVYGAKSTYIVVILSDETTPAPLATLSKQIYNYLNN